VDCKSQTVIVEEYGKLVYRSSFREFVNTDFDSDMETAGKVVGIKILKTCE
jgi:hypothetical protein